jgi:AcrR family transcriptional regulator
MNEKTETQKRILEKSLDLFSRKGFKATTTREIARDADVNEITIFRNFNSKEELLVESLDYGFDPEGLKESVPNDFSGNLEEDLFSLVSTMRNNLRSREKVYSIMFREMATNEIVRDKVSEMPRIMKGFMVGKLEAILKERSRSDVDLETAGVFLASYILRSEMMRMLLGKDPFHELDNTRLRESISIFLYGMINGGDRS